MDEACIKFSRAFYQALFSDCKTPWESFNIAQQTLSISKGLEGQSALFVMRTSNSVEEEHKWNSFVLFRGKSNKVNRDSKVRFTGNLPSKVEPFIGRNEDIRTVMLLIQKFRLVTITGEPGIGKTSVAKAVIHYLKDRDEELIKNGVSFLNVVNWSSLPLLIHWFISTIEEGIGTKLVNRIEKKDTMEIFKEILKFLRDLEILIVIDNAEDLLIIDKNILKEFLEKLFESSTKMKVLLTSKIEPVSYLGGISGVADRVFKLRPLSTQFSEKLLSEKAGKVIPKEERLEMQKRETERVHGGFKSAYHHLFESLLGGHPIAISLAGSLYANVSLGKLYETLVKSTLLNSLTQGTDGKSNISNNLYLSLNLSLKLYRNKKIYEFFHMMGYLPGGAREEDIDQIWQEVSKSELHDWRPMSTYLENASIVIKKKVKLNKDSIEVYQLVPMLKNIAEESRNQKERNRLHDIVTMYYIQILDEILKSNSVSKQSQDNEALMNTLWFFEMNVWDWVYRALEIKKNHIIGNFETKISDRNSRSVSPNKETKDEMKESHNIKRVNPSNIQGSDGEDEVIIEDNMIKVDDEPSTTPTNGNYDLLKALVKNTEYERERDNEDNIFDEFVNKVKTSIMPRSISGDLEDGNVLSFIEKSVNPEKNENKLIKPTKKIVKKVNASANDETSFLIREMDKKLKKTINEKVAAMIKNDKKLSSIMIPKDEIYSKLAHKIYEVQENHKLYKGTATNQVCQKGKTIKEINNDSKLLILYLSNLILFSKKSDAVKTIDEYGKYFYDKSLSEANLRKLKALALIRNKKENNFENATDAVKEFLRAKVIFQNNESHHGTAIWWAGIGFILYEIFIHYTNNTTSLLKYAK